MNGAPGTVKIAEYGQLLLEDSTTAIPTTVVIPKDHSHGERKASESARQAKITIGEIPNKENGIRLEKLQKLFIRIAPGAMQITSNGKSQVRQSGCLGYGHPAPLRS